MVLPGSYSARVLPFVSPSSSAWTAARRYSIREGIEDGGDGEGVAEVEPVAVGVDVEPALDKSGGGLLAGRDGGLPVAFPGEEDISADVQSDQGDGRAGLEDDVGGAGVAVGVELGVGGYVAGDFDGAAHDDKLL